MADNHILIPGGSGYQGRYIANYFKEKGYKVYILTRGELKSRGAVEYVYWDGENMGDWATLLEGASAVINLAGRTVNCRYTEENKRQILDSRIKSTAIIGQAIAACKKPPAVWLNSSTATTYKDTRGDLPANDEFSDQIGDDFSMTIAKTWETTFNEATTPNTRKCILRTAITIGHEDGGAMEYLLGLVRFWLGGTQGSGDQYVSWIHIHDLARIIDFLIERTDLDGIFNCAAPNPETNRDFMKKLRFAYGRSWGLPLPKFLLQIGAVFLKTEVELVLKSRKVLSKRLPDAGFQFQFNTVEEAFGYIVKMLRTSRPK